MRILSIFLTMLLCKVLLAQQYDRQWMIGYMGTSPSGDTILGINNIVFNQGNPNIFRENKTISIYGGGGSVCDRYGELQCFTNGFTLHNRSDLAMPNGLGLNPGNVTNDYYTNQRSDCYPTSHGPIFIAKPGSDSIYYIFHSALEYGTTAGFFCKFLYYTILDMQMQNGFGDVIDKNHLLIEDTILGNGGMAACKHANGRDWWIIMQEANNNCFDKLLLTPNGIEMVATQCIGDSMHVINDRGSNVFSPNGDRYIWSNPYEQLNIVDFDRCTGMFSNYKHYNIIDSFANSQATVFIDGVSVSPNSKYLYLATGTELRQFDLDADSVEKSEIIIDNTLNGIPKTSVMFAQLAIDGKIYLCPNSQDTFLHVIEYPDSFGLACHFKRNAVKLPSYNNYSLPYYPNYRLGPLTGSGCDTIISTGIKRETLDEKILKLYPNPVTDFVTIDYGFTDWNKGGVSLEIVDAPWSGCLQPGAAHVQRPAKNRCA